MTSNQNGDKKTFDYIILGAGIYGLYSAKVLAAKHKKVAIVEYEKTPFQRGSYINQARVHLGYHYPRSISTALKSAGYFERFKREFQFAINDSFLKIYAISQKYSLTPGEHFVKFCERAGIRCNAVDPSRYFNDNQIESAFEAEEYAFDAFKIRDSFLEYLNRQPNVTFFYEARIREVDVNNDKYTIVLQSGERISAQNVINATYASINQVLKQFDFEPFKIKYEICEVILGKANATLQNLGITVMDGPFFSIMPFGMGDMHSLTAVSFTPHKTSYSELPTFSCQQLNPNCTPGSLANCNTCPAKPKSAWPYMSKLAHKYLVPEMQFDYQKSLFTIKPILRSSEMDDSRPTLIRVFSEKPRFISVLSGKINTIYDLDPFLI